jgi:hypothetical protein
MKRRFQAIYSIELSLELYERARRRFVGVDRVRLIQGDSGEILPELAASIPEPCLFWLDGHYSYGETARGEEDSPLRKELAAVLARDQGRDVILIDDARYLTGRDGYPSLAEIRASVGRARPDWVVEVARDIVRIHPRD